MIAVVLAGANGATIGADGPLSLIDIQGAPLLQSQVRILREFLPVEAIYVVVSHGAILIIDRFPDFTYVYEPGEGTPPDTAVGLLKALRRAPNDDTVWLRGDLYFERAALVRIVDTTGSCVAVSRCAGDRGPVDAPDADGLVAVGLNKVCRADRQPFIDALRWCDRDDSFDKALAARSLDFASIEVSDVLCTRVRHRTLGPLSPAPSRR